MAGSQNIGEASDNPVAINVTAMVDVIFCLCIFFMCSFKFKQLEGKIESWLPRGSAAVAGARDTADLPPVSIVLRWDAGRNATERRVGRVVANDEELISNLLGMAEDHRKVGKAQGEIPVEIRADRAVPWEEVVHVMDLCRKQKLEKIAFSAYAGS